MDINGVAPYGAQTKIMGILGRGIAHTLSPLLHNAAMRELGVDGIYLVFDCSQGFPTRGFFDAMWDAGAIGFNVTFPYKETAASQFRSSELASVNTIFRDKDAWKTTSTDGLGFLRGLLEINFKLEDFQTVIYLGNGGSALALCEIFESVRPEGLRHIVLRRSSQRDPLWQKVCGKRFEAFDFTPDSLTRLLRTHPKTLLIQTTDAPLKGESLSHMASALVPYEGAFVDLVYGKPSALVSRCRDLKVPAQDGLPMLIGQAILSQELWWGTAVSFDFLEKISFHYQFLSSS